jgi:hypothetical protein
MAMLTNLDPKDKQEDEICDKRIEAMLRRIGEINSLGEYRVPSSK